MLKGVGHIFITFEGGEGSGKSTQIQMLLEYLQDAGHDVLCLRDPGGTFISEKIREILKDTDNAAITQKTEAMLYLAARSQMFDELLKPCLDRGGIVICDRYSDSTVVYQGYAGGINLDMLKAFCIFASNGLEPDLTFYLQLDPVLGLERKKCQGELDRTELKGFEFHKQVADAYDMEAKKHPKRIKTIDATLPPEEIASIIIKYVNKLLK